MHLGEALTAHLRSVCNLGAADDSQEEGKGGGAGKQDEGAVKMLPRLEGSRTRQTFRWRDRAVDLGAATGRVTIDAELRNRTAPFPFRGDRFEFRTVGASQNASMVNTVLCTAIGEAFRKLADEIERGYDPMAVVSRSLQRCWAVVFNGNCYSDEWVARAQRLQLPNIESGVEAVERGLTRAENVAMFQNTGVMQKHEVRTLGDGALATHPV